MFALELETWVDYVVAVTAVLGALALVGRLIIQPIVRAVRKVVATVDRVEAAVVFVEAEMKPNGGSSLRDAVNRIEATVAAHEGRLVIDDQRFDRIELKLRGVPQAPLDDDETPETPAPV